MDKVTAIVKKVKMLGDASTFSWAQAFSDKSGKTSITSILAAVIVVGSMLLLLISGIAALFGVASGPTIASYALAALGLGAGTAGVNKVMGGKVNIEDTVVDMSVPDAKDASDVSSPPNGPAPETP